MNESMKRAEMEFRQKNHQLMLIADSVPIHLNYLDADQRFQFVNQAAADFWGMKPDEIIGKRIIDLMGENDYLKIKDTFERVLQGEPLNHETPFKNAFGSTQYFLNHYIPDFDSAGRVIGFVATGQDITERKLALEEAHRLVEEFRNLADSMPQIVWTANPDGHVDYYNRRWYEFTGLPSGSADNALWAEILHPDDAEPLRVTWLKALKDGQPYELQFRVKHAPTGEFRWLLSRARSVRDAQGNILKWYGSNTDIHDQKMLLNHLKNEQELREQIIATLSHDMRTPLTVAKMSAELMLRAHLDPQVQTLAFRIQESMKRADKMIQDLLDASQIKAGHAITLKRVRCNLVELTASIIDEFTLMHGNAFDFKSPQTLEGNWDCEAIRRILENLISNAIKYGYNGSKIGVQLLELKDLVEIKVTNFGNPIPSHELSTLFDPYKRMESAKHIKGWGLGLSLVKGFAEAHGGRASVTSDSESGTVFTVTLPFIIPSKST